MEALALTSKNRDEISKASNDCIDLQQKEGLVHLEGMANEQASLILEGLTSDTSIAYLDAAKKVYKNKWGAIAKYELLRARGSM